MRECCAAVTAQFDEKLVEKSVRRLERKGPGGTTRLLVDALRAVGVEGCSVLDVGGGAGVIPEELLAAGAATATYTDASRPFMEAARARGAMGGWGDRVRYHVGDFVELAPALDGADIVTLDRVLCCDPRLDALMEASLAKAGRFWAATYPRERWSVRTVIRVQNAVRRLRGSGFRVYVHPVARIRAALERAGFYPRSSARTFVWEAVVFERRPEAVRRSA